MPARGKTSKTTQAANMDAVLDALADGCTYTEAAQRAGVLPATVTRYTHDPAFLLRLQQRRDGITAAVAASLTAGAREAVRTLRDAVQDPTASDNTRVRAAAALLAHADNWRNAELDARLTELEEAQQQGHLRAI